MRMIISITIALFMITTMLISACGPAQYTINTSVSPNGSGSVSPESGNYNEGTEVTLVAEPASGYRFDHWSGDAAGESSPVTIVLDTEKSVIANFVAQHMLTVSANPASAGTVTPDTGLFDEGATVSLTATPAPAYRFDHWSGDLSSTSSSVTVIIEQDMNVSAHFVILIPSYSDVLKTYPADADICTNKTHVTGVNQDGSWKIVIPSDTKLKIVDGKLVLDFTLNCYGVQVTLDVPVTIGSKTYPPGTKLTRDKDLEWVEVSSGD